MSSKRHFVQNDVAAPASGLRIEMATAPFGSAGIDSKRPRALPIPGANADMNTFIPDSSIASDVIPSPNFGERNGGIAADMILLHYTGMPDVEAAIAKLCTPGTDVS